MGDIWGRVNGTYAIDSSSCRSLLGVNEDVGHCHIVVLIWMRCDMGLTMCVVYGYSHRKMSLLFHTDACSVGVVVGCVSHVV